ncbi:MAG TPA: CHASE3 domain-containing protein [Opitutaceae bacterium]
MSTSTHPKPGSRSLLLSRPVVLGGLVAAFALVVTTALLSTVATRGVTAANESIARVQTTLIAINQLRTALADAEAGQRGYILTGAPEHLEAYQQAAWRFRQETAGLGNRFKGDSVQQAALAELQHVATEKFAEMTRTTELRREGGIGAAINIVDSDRSIAAMHRLRLQLREVEKREFAELAERSDHASDRAQLFQNINVGMIGVALALAGIGATLLLRRMRELERLIPVCAWTHRVRDGGKWLTFEEYLGKRFHLRFTHGISEEAAQKMRADAVELSQAFNNAHHTSADSASPFPMNSAVPFPLHSAPPFPADSRPQILIESDSPPPIDLRRIGRGTSAVVSSR